MKTKLTFILGLLTAVLVSSAPAQNTVVTYQGRLQSAGSDFTGTGQFKFALVTVTNAAATATATANPPSGGFITVITPTFGGSGYITPPAITITGGGGSEATATATLTGGAVTSITVNNVGSGYTSTPTVTIAPPPEALAYTTYWSNDDTSVAGSEPAAAVSLPVNAALFVARLGDTSVANMMALPGGLFAQPDLHLRLWFDDGVNGFAALHATQPLSAAPYAFAAGSASNLLGTVTTANLSGTYSQPITFNNAANTFSGNGAGLTALNASQLTSGTVPNARLAANVARTNQVWLLGGNAGTSPETHVLGTSDNQALELKVNGRRALRLEQASGDAVNVIGGSVRNAVGAGVRGATIGGGGGFFSSFTNRVDADWGTISGGARNAIESDAVYATLSGGNQNRIESEALYATLSGGLANKIQTNANYATIPGGLGNSATNYAFAVGRRAKANHTGAFVWADSTDANFASTTTNQFNVRANGGARFVTSGAGLTVDGNVGIGETAPEGQLHITGPQNTPQIKIETTANDSFVKLRLESFGKPYWDFAVGGSANVMNWYYSGTEQNLMSLSTSGTLTTVGPVNPPSDRNVKQDFTPIDAVAVLEKVAALPIQSWAYKNSPETRHIGPVAQDFHAAFQFNGADDKHISTVDADGVALAAIQGLNAKVESGKQKAETRMV